MEFQYGPPPAIDPILKWALFSQCPYTSCSTSSSSWHFCNTFDGRHWLPFPHSALLMHQRMCIAYFFFFVRTHRGHRRKNISVFFFFCVLFLLLCQSMFVMEKHRNTFLCNRRLRLMVSAKQKAAHGCQCFSFIHLFIFFSS